MCLNTAPIVGQEWMVNNMRLIDIEPFESGKDICGCSIQIRRWGDGYSSVCSISTADIPTIDAVPITRCSECKNWLSYPSLGVNYCGLHKGLAVANKDTYCSYAERKE